MGLLTAGIIAVATGAALTITGGVMKGVGEYNESHGKDEEEEDEDDD